MIKKLKIFTVDDEISITEIVCEFLELFVHTDVFTSNNSKEAIHRLGEEKFDLIITDHFMPEFTGIDLLKSVRQVNSINLETPVFILTSLHSEVEQEINGIFDHTKVLNKVESLHLIGTHVLDVFPDFKNPLAN